LQLCASRTSEVWVAPRACSARLKRPLFK